MTKKRQPVLVPNGESFDGNKRQRVPYDILWTCPNCGKTYDEPINGDCVSYPTIGKKAAPFGYRLSCEGEGPDGAWVECWSGRLPIRLTLVAEVAGKLKAGE